jgi:nucleoside-diphosphate-sugar epimerase
MSAKRKVVITGGAGFIGSQLGYRLVQEEWDVVLLDNMYAGYLDNLVVDGKTFGTLVVRDIRDPGLTRVMDGAEVVFHFAGIAPLPVCQSEPMFGYDVNTSGTANVLEAARRAGVRRVIFSSTSAVYECNTNPKLCESDPVSPNLVYAMTKLASEALCKAFAENYGMDILIPRFFNVYGPHQDFRRTSPPFTSYVARELCANRVPVLYNKSDARRDYVHMDDVIRLLVQMIDAPKKYSAEVFNVASGKGFSVRELYQKLARIANKKIEPEFRSPEVFWDAYDALFLPPFPLSRERVKKEVFKTAIASTSKTEQEFGWKVAIDIDEGLASVYEYTARHFR